MQTALPWGLEVPVAWRGRRRETELADRLRRANRQVFRLRGDLAEARVIAEGLRWDLAAAEQRADQAEAALNRGSVRQSVEADVQPWRFGRLSADR